MTTRARRSLRAGQRSRSGVCRRELGYFTSPYAERAKLGVPKIDRQDDVFFTPSTVAQELSRSDDDAVANRRRAAEPAPKDMYFMTGGQQVMIGSVTSARRRAPRTLQSRHRTARRAEP
jgi:hypothetical protein